MKKPRISSRCGANAYAGPRETIAEFSSPNGGGLFHLTMIDDRLQVSLGRLDPTVDVFVGTSPVAESITLGVKHGSISQEAALKAVQLGGWSDNCKGIVAAAQEITDPSVVSFDDTPLIRQEQGGCWVQAWVWVENVYVEG